MSQVQTKSVQKETIIIRFAGDSGDGIQITGGQFTNTSARFGNDVHTFPDFPAEIRAPAGTLPGVSGFQLSFSSLDIHTPGDRLDALIAMNPAALKANLADLCGNGLLILNENSFQEKDLKKAGYRVNPISSGELSGYQVFALPLTDLTLNAVNDCDIPHSKASKCKNMFALGIVYWLYDRQILATEQWLEKKYSAMPEVAHANKQALKAGYNYALTSELFSQRYIVAKAQLKTGTYRQVTGNEAFALGCAAVAVQAERPLLFSSYPITPASSVLQEVVRLKQFGLQTFQAEDEIAAMAATIGAAFGGSLAVTCTSGPGLDLKAEGLGLAVMAELPMVVLNIQRAGPSTGMPTKPEQSDLLSAVYGRHGECPIPVLAPATPGECFTMLFEAFNIAIQSMTPVILLSDAYLAMGAEPWRLPDVNQLPSLNIPGTSRLDRDPHSLAKPWVVPGTDSAQFRVGGLEKDIVSSNISYDPDNHQAMVKLRHRKIRNLENLFELNDIIGADSGELLLIGWGSTYGTLLTAVEQLQKQGLPISLLHLRHLYPFPRALAGVLKRFKRIAVAEMNLGQLAHLLQCEYQVKPLQINKVSGKPFLVAEIEAELLNMLEVSHA